MTHFSCEQTIRAVHHIPELDQNSGVPVVLFSSVKIENIVLPVLNTIKKFYNYGLILELGAQTSYYAL